LAFKVVQSNNGLAGWLAAAAAAAAAGGDNEGNLWLCAISGSGCRVSVPSVLVPTPSAARLPARASPWRNVVLALRLNGAVRLRIEQ